MSAQAMDALAIANRRRRESVAIRSQIAAMQMAEAFHRVAAMLEEPCPATGALRADRLIGAIPFVGARKIIRLSQMAPLTLAQRLDPRTLLRRGQRLIPAARLAHDPHGDHDATLLHCVQGESSACSMSSKMAWATRGAGR